jgi:PAS domain S-box-containing protein
LPEETSWLLLLNLPAVFREEQISIMPQEFDAVLLQAALENSYDIITLIQEDGTILYSNPAFFEVLGYEVQDVMGTNAFDLVHPDDLSQLQQEFAQALQQGRGEVSIYRLRTKHEDWRWIKSTGALLTHYPPRKAIIHSRDETLQIQAKAAQEKVSQDILTIWESMTDAFFALNTHWCFTYINAQGERILQRKREDLLGKSIWNDFPDAVNTTFYHQYHKAVAEQTPVHFETFYSPLHVWVDVHAYPSSAGLMVYFHNINERKQTEERLKESQRQLAEAQRIADLGSWEWDITADKLRWSDETFHHFGLEPQGFVATYEAFLGCVHPEDRECVQKTVARAMREQQQYEEYFRIVQPTGAISILHSRGVIIRDDNGKPIKVVGIDQDVTEQRQAEQARQELLQRLVTAQEEERRRIALELHDGMSQHLVALMLGLKSLPAQDQFPPVAVERIQQLLELIENLMQQTRCLALDLRSEVIDRLGLATALKRYTWEWSQANGIPVSIKCTGFEGQRFSWQIETTIYRVVQEALTNILRHAQAQDVAVLIEYRHQEITAIVEDDGAGFDQEAVAAKPPEERGLGLLGMQERLSLVRGALEVESNLGVGTTIFIRVPVPAQDDKD